MDLLSNRTTTFVSKIIQAHIWSKHLIRKLHFILKTTKIVPDSCQQDVKMWWPLVLQVVLNYYIAFGCCNRLLILLFQLSLKFERLTEFDIHSRFDEKLSTYASNILYVKCTARKEKFAVLQTKISLARREEEKSCKFLHSFHHLFQVTKFSRRFKIATVSNINTISKKQLRCQLN